MPPSKINSTQRPHVPSTVRDVQEVVHGEGGTLSRPTRILHLVEAFGGGVFEMVRTLAEGLAREGHVVAIAHGRRPETPWPVRESIDPSVALFALPWDKRSPWAQARATLSVRPLVRAWRPDLVHLHSSFAGVVGALTLPSVIPTVYTPNAYSFTMTNHGDAWAGMFRLMERYVAKRVTVTGAASASEGMLAEDVVGAEHVRVVPNGISELNSPAVVDERPGKPLVVGMGRTSPQRQPEGAARILSGLGDLADTQWIGGVSDASAGSQALASAGVPLTGWMRRDKAMAALYRATVYLHWTGWDGLPLSVLEAMAGDVLVIASDIPPNREILGPGQVCATEAEALALIREVLESPELLSELRRSQRLLRTRFSANAMVTGWSSVYQELVTGGIPESSHCHHRVPQPAP